MVCPCRLSCQCVPLALAPRLKRTHTGLVTFSNHIMLIWYSEAKFGKSQAKQHYLGHWLLKHSLSGNYLVKKMNGLRYYIPKFLGCGSFGIIGTQREEVRVNFFMARCMKHSILIESPPWLWFVSRKKKHMKWRFPNTHNKERNVNGG